MGARSGRISRSLVSLGMLSVPLFLGCAALLQHTRASRCTARALERVGWAVRALRLRLSLVTHAFNRVVSTVPASDPAPSLPGGRCSVQEARSRDDWKKPCRGWQGPPRAGPPVAWLVVADGV